MTKLQKINKISDLLYKLGKSEPQMDDSKTDELLFVLFRSYLYTSKVEIKLQLKDVAEQILEAINDK